MYKKIFSRIYITLAGLVALTAAVKLLSDHHLVWYGVMLTAVPPLVNVVFPFDNLCQPHHKVRLPRVSVLVLCGLALVLLSLRERGLPLWLALVCVGGYLLNTYWAAEVKRF